MVYFVHSYEMVKIPCILIPGLTSKFRWFERTLRGGSNLNWVKSNSKFVRSNAEICRFHERMIIAKIILFKFDIIYGWGRACLLRLRGNSKSTFSVTFPFKFLMKTLGTFCHGSRLETITWSVP